MTRFTMDRSFIRAEVDRRTAAESEPVHIPPPPPVRRRWSARVFVVPAVVAEALAKLAARTSQVMDVAERHASRRHRGVYIWQSAEAANQDSSDADLMQMPDVSTAELEVSKLKGKPLH